MKMQCNKTFIPTWREGYIRYIYIQTTRFNNKPIAFKALNAIKSIDGNFFSVSFHLKKKHHIQVNYTNKYNFCLVRRIHFFFTECMRSMSIRLL